MSVRTSTTDVRWVPSHACVKTHLFEKYNLEVRDVVGNHGADVLAGRAAKMVEATPDEAKPVLALLANLQLIQRWLVSALHFVVSHFPRAAVARKSRLQVEPVARQLLLSAHTVVLRTDSAL